MTMTPEARKAYNQYRREWAKKNPEKVKEYTNRHWEKKAKEAQDRKENQ